MIRLLYGVLKTGWALRAVVAIALGFCLVPFAVMALTAVGAQGADSGIQVFAGSVGIIAACSAFIGIQSAMESSVRGRLSLVSTLDDIGSPPFRTLVLLMMESLLVSALGSSIAFAVAAVSQPLWSGYMSSLNLASVKLELDSMFGALIITFAGAIAVTQLSLQRSFVKMYSAIRGRSPGGAKKHRARRFLALGLRTILLVAVVTLWALAGRNSAGYVIGLVGAIALVPALPFVLTTIYEMLARVIAKIPVGRKFFPLRYISGSYAAVGKVSATIGAIMVAFGLVYVAGHYFVVDATARSSWEDTLGRTNLVWDVGPGAAPNQGFESKGNLEWWGTASMEDGVDVLVASPGLLRSGDNKFFNEGDPPESAGRLFVSSAAYPDGLGMTEDELQAIRNSLGIDASAPSGDLRLSPILVPGTFGDFIYVCGDDSCSGVEAVLTDVHVVTKDATTETSFGPPAGKSEARTVEEWVRQLPTNGLVSSSGGAGVSEAALIGAIPIFVGFGLTFNGSLAAQIREIDLKRRMESLGTGARWDVSVYIVEVLYVVVIPAAVVAAASSFLLLRADMLALASLGSQTESVSLFWLSLLAVCISYLAHLFSKALAFLIARNGRLRLGRA